MIGNNNCSRLRKIAKTRITFFDLFGGGQKVISGFYSVRCSWDIKMKSFKQTETTLKNIFVV